jgi:tetratricopeptide (TPR) repeat protein
VATDRAATLRNAEQLVRQGKLQPAIAEYLRAIEESPKDWAIANTLGDLYVRTGQTDKAIEQFRGVADGLFRDGFLPKAAAVYKKVLKLSPDDEHALQQAAEIAGRQGLFADARSYLTTIVEKRKARGDTRGAAEARIRLGGLDAGDYEGRIAAANARVEIGGPTRSTR